VKIESQNVEFVFKDLKYTLKELNNKVSSPVEVRRNFGIFITLSQKLTEVMRKEFKAITSEDWQASKFEGWNDVANLFKELRREDYHEYPMTINVMEQQHYLHAIYEDEEGNELNEYFSPCVTWELGDPFATEIPIGSTMTLLGYDEDKKPIGELIPEKVEYRYVVSPKTDKVDKMLKELEDEDVISLCTKCFEILEKYLEYYKAKIKETTN